MVLSKGVGVWLGKQKRRSYRIGFEFCMIIFPDASIFCRLKIPYHHIFSDGVPYTVAGCPQIVYPCPWLFCDNSVSGRTHIAELSLGYLRIS